ncbi:DsbA family protein [Cognatilysobacter terrigena]|uniref:DsbA family protein n=1 Tax=Cognatilysobacter terrigena TaxID=2488749 RepID=UPI00105F88FE|nr:thioredoxin domain-containing protein [Lysobacter terrigena]
MATLRIPVTAADHIFGSTHAAVTLVEYGDYQCPHCAVAQLPVKQILVRYAGSVMLVFRHFPLSEVHPMAGMAAEAAEFAGSHMKFWEMHDALFANQPRLSPETLQSLATELELSAHALREALASGRYAPKVQADFVGGVRSGVNGTPTFFVNGVRHDGEYSVAGLSRSIDWAMAATT